MDINDAHIAERIVWRAAKHNLPAKETFLYADAPEQMRLAIQDATARHGIGDSVLVFGATLDRWTVVGTRGAASSHSGKTCHFRHRDVRGFEDADLGMEKRTFQFLDVLLTRRRRRRVWGPPAAQAFALWNILLMLSGMKQR